MNWWWLIAMIVGGVGGYYFGWHLAAMQSRRKWIKQQEAVDQQFKKIADEYRKEQKA